VPTPRRPLAALVFAGLLLALVAPSGAAASSTNPNRGEMAVRLVSAFGLTATSGIRFKDAPKTGSLAIAIDKVITAKIATGCGSGKFCPSSSVTRARMASYLDRALHLTVAASEPFSDVTSSTAFVASIRHLVKVGIAIPCATNKFCPTRAITGTETTAFLKKALAITRVSAAQPVPGNPDGTASIPAGAGAVDTSSPDHVVGTGTPASCTSAAVVAAVAKGGVITFDCGPDPVRIRMAATAKVHNDKPDVVIDGGGLVTLDGQNARRILYMNTCDQSLVWTTDHCQNQAHPTLTLQRLTFVYGRSTGTATQDGGGAVFVRGGRFKVVESGFYGNRCASTGPDVGGASIQVFSQYDGLPVYIVDSTFGGDGARRNECSNGGGISSIGVSWTIVNSVFTGNHAIGRGANPAKSGTPGGGNGGAIYNDGNTMILDVRGTRIEGNTSNHEGGSGIFYVSNDRSGSVAISGSTLQHNTGDGFSTYPGIFFLGSSITFTNSTVQ
jgi:S-layer homology domain